jgi:hypothetical protein
MSLENDIKGLERFLNHVFSNTVVLESGQVVEQRAEVGRSGNLKFEIYPNEHPPPHFHVKSPELNVSISILDCRIIKGQLSKSDLKKMQYFYRLNRKKLIGTWNLLRPTDCSVGLIIEE